MGQAGGLADYWAVFGEVEGLQGGFVWEWADHGLRRHEPDGTTWIAYGGDFGESEHDGNFVCDGLVSADRDPHPLLGELAALTQPVAVEAAGRRTSAGAATGAGSPISTTSRRRWELSVDGRRVAGGDLDVPAIGPRSSKVVPMPSLPTAAEDRPDDARRAVHARGAGPPWATRRVDRVGVVDRPLRGDRGRCRVAGSSRSRSVTTASSLGDVVLGWPALSLWRAPTDNDDPPGEWRATTPAAGWRADGLDRLVEGGTEIGRRGRVTTRVVRYETGTGQPIEHRQRIEVVDGVARISERIAIDRSIADLPRVGVQFTLPVRLRSADLARPRPRRLLSGPTGGGSLRAVGGAGRRDSPCRSCGHRSTACTSTPNGSTWPRRGSPCVSPVTNRWRSRPCPTPSPSWKQRPTPISCRRRAPLTCTSTSPIGASGRQPAAPTPTLATWCAAVPIASPGPSPPPAPDPLPQSDVHRIGASGSGKRRRQVGLRSAS